MDGRAVRDVYRGKQNTSGSGGFRAVPACPSARARVGCAEGKASGSGHCYEQKKCVWQSVY
jgi:hypothetical protein